MLHWTLNCSLSCVAPCGLRSTSGRRPGRQRPQEHTGTVARDSRTGTTTTRTGARRLGPSAASATGSPCKRRPCPNPVAFWPGGPDPRPVPPPRLPVRRRVPFQEANRSGAVLHVHDLALQSVRSAQPAMRTPCQAACAALRRNRRAPRGRVVRAASWRLLVADRAYFVPRPESSGRATAPGPNASVTFIHDQINFILHQTSQAPVCPSPINGRGEITGLFCWKWGVTGQGCMPWNVMWSLCAWCQTQ
jgi:hypothetical protein